METSILISDQLQFHNKTALDWGVLKLGLQIRSCLFWYKLEVVQYNVSTKLRSKSYNRDRSMSIGWGHFKWEVLQYEWQSHFCPMQIRGPPPNGKYDSLPFVAFETPENLSGANSFALSPQSS